MEPKPLKSAKRKQEVHMKQLVVGQRSYKPELAKEWKSEPIVYGLDESGRVWEYRNSKWELTRFFSSRTFIWPPTQ